MELVFAFLAPWLLALVALEVLSHIDALGPDGITFILVAAFLGSCWLISEVRDYKESLAGIEREEFEEYDALEEDEEP